MITIEKTKHINYTQFMNTSTLISAGIFDETNRKYYRNCMVFSRKRKNVFDTYEEAWRFAWRLVSGVSALTRLDAMRQRVKIKMLYK